MATTIAPTMTTPKVSATSHPYTCNTCQVAFKGSDLQRGHMQSDWHRYNLKRRVASLPPLASDVFADKVLTNQASAAATAARASFEKICAACARTYYSENAYGNHLQSQKHKAKLVQLANESALSTDAGETDSMISSIVSLDQTTNESESEEEEEDDDKDDGGDGEEDDAKSVTQNDLTSVVNRMSAAHISEATTNGVGLTSGTRVQPTPTPATLSSATADSTKSTDTDPTLECLFCNTTSADSPANVLHMSKAHGLFIPEPSYLVDLPGLLSYLHDRVHALHECLYCGQLKYTTTGIQTHMRDKGHCMIAFESEVEMVEVGEFYDFTSTYSDDDISEDEEMQELAQPSTPKPKLGAARKATITPADGEADSDEDDEEWEEEEDDSDAETTTTTATKSTRKSLKNQAYEFDGELYLPSGRTAGHRSLARYYRQNLRNYPSATERAEQQQIARQRAIDRAEGHDSSDDDNNEEEEGAEGGEVSAVPRGHSRAVVTRANGGLGLLSAPEHLRKAAAKMEIKDKRREQRAWTNFRAGNERQNNNQKHFRDPLLQ